MPDIPSDLLVLATVFGILGVGLRVERRGHPVTALALAYLVLVPAVAYLLVR